MCVCVCGCVDVYVCVCVIVSVCCELFDVLGRHDIILGHMLYRHVLELPPVGLFAREVLQKGEGVFVI